MLNLVFYNIKKFIYRFIIVITQISSINTSNNDIFLKDRKYTNTWVIHLQGGENKAKEFLQEFNLTYLGPVGSLDNLYMIKHTEDNFVSNYNNNDNFNNNGKSKHRFRRNIEFIRKTLVDFHGLQYVQQQKILPRQKRGYFEDPLYSKQWYLENQDSTKGECSLDMNIVAVWKKGITGKGAIVTVVDDGIDYKHPDLKKNYDPQASYDYIDRDDDPTPMKNHGTRCAGEVAADANNDICGAGVAYNAKIGGIRILDGQLTDALEASALSHKQDYIHIYSNSWGPTDNGATVSGPQELAMKAILNGITNGRNGLGSIYVWATGNGGRAKDYCSCDGYVNLPYTISIGAVDSCGKSPEYAEQCPATLAVTFSGNSDPNNNKHITTTDLNGKCTTKHTGTSAASPLAAGVIALLLESNAKVTWRDVQHLIVNTAKVINGNDDSKWTMNGAGRKVSEYYGFGVLDTESLIEAAMSPKWKTVEPQNICNSTEDLSQEVIVPNKEVVRTIDAKACSNDTTTCVDALEYVQVILSLRSYPRGGLQIYLTSPAGTVSPILKWRDNDGNSIFADWAFSSVFHWGENPLGKWKLSVKQHHPFGGIGTLVKWKLRFYGTCSKKSEQEKEKRVETLSYVIKEALKSSQVITLAPSKSIPLKSTTVKVTPSLSSIYSSRTKLRSAIINLLSVTPSKTNSIKQSQHVNNVVPNPDLIAKLSTNKSLPPLDKYEATSSSSRKIISMSDVPALAPPKGNFKPSRLINTIKHFKVSKSPILRVFNTPSSITQVHYLEPSSSRTFIKSTISISTTGLPSTLTKVPSTTTTTTKTTTQTTATTSKPTAKPTTKTTLKTSTVTTQTKTSTATTAHTTTTALTKELPSTSTSTTTTTTTTKTTSKSTKDNPSTERKKTAIKTTTEAAITITKPTLPITKTASMSKTNTTTPTTKTTPTTITTRTKITSKNSTANKTTIITTTTMLPATTITVKTTAPTTAPINVIKNISTVVKKSAKPKINDSIKNNEDKLTMYIGITIASIIVLLIVITGIAFGVRKYINEKPVLVKQQREISYVNDAYVPTKTNLEYYR